MRHVHVTVPNATTPAATNGFHQFRIQRDTTYMGAGSSDDADRNCASVGATLKIGSPSSTSVMCSSTIVDDCWTTCTEDDLWTTAKSNFVQNTIFPQVFDWIESAFRTVDFIDPLHLTTSSKCGPSGEGVTVPASYALPGVAKDYVVFVTARPVRSNAMAWASSCQFDSSTGRPIAAMINLSPKYMTADSETMYSRVMTHELFHALGFSSSIFSDISGAVTSSTATGVEVHTMRLSGVVAKAQAYFGCPSLTGVDLEQGGGGGTAHSHWEARILLDELMMGRASNVMTISPLTFAYFEATGWYQMDYSKAETTMKWGKGKGCPFVTSTCTAANWGSLWCSAMASAQDFACTYNRLAIGACNLYHYDQSLPSYYQHFTDATLGSSDSLADYCPYVVQYSNTVCTGDASVVANQCGSQYCRGGTWGTPSGRCFESSLVLEGYSLSAAPVTCHQTQCNQGTLSLLVGSQWIVCPVAGGEVSVAGYTGKVTCPAANTICAAAFNGTLELTSPAPGSNATTWRAGTRQAVTWKSTGGSFTINVAIQSQTDASIVKSLAVGLSVTDGSVTVTVPSSLTPGSYLVVLTADDVGLRANASVTLTAAAFVFSAPAAGAVWNWGTTHNIAWTTADSVQGQNVKVALTLGGATVRVLNETVVATASASLAWIVPDGLTQSDQYQIYIEATGLTGQNAFSDLFSIKSAQGGAASMVRPLIWLLAVLLVATMM
eukprot:GAFH01000928.1.p1 GENE.GAFH01000928.1~~GAFH01000928.1.p1  ORF type:complete len:750 (+),score=134.50 GAFH01000928.1:92-2251(+)